MNASEIAYLDLVRLIYERGVDKSDRTGTGTRSLFGHQLRFDLAAGFPLLTTKRMFTRGIIHELLWFLRGETNVAGLHEHNVHIWDEWADENGNLGPIYGRQWRLWPTADGHVVDQIAAVIEQLKANPNDRRMVVSAWNVADLPKMRLAPCHCLFQFYVANGRLSCHMYQRSADVFLGVPFNIASYALLTQMVAGIVGLDLGDLIISFGDVHIYRNHFDQVTLQLSREPHPAPRMKINARASIDDFEPEDFELIGYTSHPSIVAEVSV